MVMTGSAPLIAIRGAHRYVEIHTGTFPSGEIRGQVPVS
jgi:hypothetical protein